ncbi:MAG: GNAT family N-acetyltransferase [Burkholderiaceae bacterium]|nr:MAG: GNAT family N-acetyltransferase [Burkholderiaceae bacterium]
MPRPVTPYRIVALAKDHDRAGFASGSEPLDRYLHQQARQDAERRVAAPFVLVEPTSNRVLGYYTLSASVVAAEALPAELAKKLPRYPQLPVTLLGRLAVDQSQRGKGLGELLLMDALRRSLEAAAEIAAMAVIVDAKDKEAEAFYGHFGFIPLQHQPARLFLRMRTVAALFPAA